MKEVIILILLLLFLNTFLLLKNMNDNSKNSKCQPVEGFFEPANRTMTRVGPYDGITSCSSWGVRNVYDGNRPIGDDAFIFNGPQSTNNTMLNNKDCQYACKLGYECIDGQCIPQSTNFKTSLQSGSCSCDRMGDKSCPPGYSCKNTAGDNCTGVLDSCTCERDYASKSCGSPGDEDCANYEECKDGQCVLNCKAWPPS
jgi:hypothetical protein